MKREFLEKELNTLSENGKDEMQDSITKDVLEIYDKICEVADKSGHSGNSYAYLMGLVQRLIIDERLINPIKDIDEDPDDWNQVEGFGDGKAHYQNKRRSSVFCTVFENGQKQYTDVEKATFTDDVGKTWWHGSACKPYEVIKVPYMPDGKKWHIYIMPTIELEPGNGADEGFYTIYKVEYR